MSALKDALPEDFPVRHFATLDDLRVALLEDLKAGDTVMLKSSNGIGFRRIVDALLSSHAEVAPSPSPTATGGD